MRCTACRFLCLTLALLMLLPGVALAGDTPAITFSSYPSTVFRDPYTDGLIGKGAGTKAVCGQHTYILPGLLNEQIGRDYILRAEGVFKLLAAYGGTDRPMTIHLISGAYPARVDGSTLYISLSDFRSPAYITLLTQLYFGREVVYGLIYAVSCEAAAALGLAVEDVPDADAALPAFRGEGILYADMNYACFTAPYTDEAMQVNVKALARDFFASLTAEERTDLLTHYTNEAFYRRLNQYLREKKLPLRQNAQLWGISFFFGGMDVAVGWESAYASFAVCRTYEDLCEPGWYGTQEEPLVSSYADLIGWVVSLEEMLAHLQGVFAPYIDFDKPLIIFDSENVGVMASYHSYYTYGYYLPGDHTIRTGAIDVLPHEYIHALAGKTSVNLNMTEVLAYSYSTTGMPAAWSYSLRNMAYDYEMRQNPFSSNYDSGWAALRLLARVHLGHEPDYHNAADMQALIDVVTFHRGHASYSNLTAANSATFDMKGAKISFWHYLLRTYGEDAALRAALTDDPESLLGSSWTQLCDGWILWLQETYGRGTL